MTGRVISSQALQELVQLVGIHINPERLEKVAARLAVFYKEVAELDQQELGELNPDFARPLEREGL